MRPHHRRQIPWPCTQISRTKLIFEDFPCPGNFTNTISWLWEPCYTHDNHAHKYDTHTHTFNGPLSGTTQVSRYQKGKTNLDFTEARDSEWQWHQLGHMQVCISLQTDSTPPLSFLQAGYPSCRPTNSIKALKASMTRRLTLQRGT